MINAGIVGISGYSGLETLTLLLKHPDVRVTYISANNTEGRLEDIWPQLKGSIPLTCKKFDREEAVASCELVFLAVPHTASMAITPKLLKAGVKIIDLSGDYRLKTAAQYKKWYKETHTDTANLNKAVYGLPEFYREEIKKARLIANPGCYPTAALLALLPLQLTHPGWISSIIIDAKSGVSGAGRKATQALNFCEVNENFKAYKVLNHQHTPEIELYLSESAKTKVSINFVPHLLPLNRGILETIYIVSKEKLTLGKVQDLYKKFYKTEPFVRVQKPGVQPELKNVAYTNYCDIGLELSGDGRLLVITSSIDNLRKGAAGQAVQNMNLMCGFKETEGLI